jgi:hypothetical protein
VQAPIFLLGPPRSCSTVAVAMLGCHPALYSFPELLIFTANTVDELLAPALDTVASRWEKFYRSGLVRAVAQVLFGSQSQNSASLARTWLEARGQMQPELIFDDLLAAIAPRTGVEKSPDTSMRRIRLTRCFRAYPGARFVHITRHPIPSIASLAKHLALWQSASLPERAAEAASIWCQAHQTITAFSQSLREDQLIRVRAEDLLGQPAMELGRIVRWARIDESEAAIEAMQHPERWPYAAFGPRGARGGGDHIFFGAPYLRPTAGTPKMIPPSEWRLDRNAWQSVRMIAGSLGYDPEE